LHLRHFYQFGSSKQRPHRLMRYSKLSAERSQRAASGGSVQP
jgi:hypothetical protein